MSAKDYDVAVEGPVGTVPLTGGVIDEAAYPESLIQDLGFAGRAIDELRSRPVKPVASQPIAEVDTIAVALWNAAVIAYGRCFNQGRRSVIARNLVPADEVSLVAHRTITGIRGDHIAHLARGTDHERLRAAVEVKRRSSPSELAVRLEIEGNNVLLPSPAEARTYRALIDAVLARAIELKVDAFDRIQAALVALGGEELQRAARDGTTLRLD